MKKLLCKLFVHRWDEFHFYEVVCSRCYTCREWDAEDLSNWEKRMGV